MLSSLQQVAATSWPAGTGRRWPSTPRPAPSWPCTPTPPTTPTPLSGHNQSVEANAWKRSDTTPGDPLLAGRLPAALLPRLDVQDHHRRRRLRPQAAVADQVFPSSSGFVLPDTTNLLHNFGGEAAAVTLLELFTVSCDTGFAQVGLDLGATDLAAEATASGSTRPRRSTCPAWPSRTSHPPRFAQNLPGLAKSAIGQENVQATPLTMALVPRPSPMGASS